MALKGKHNWQLAVLGLFLALLLLAGCGGEFWGSVGDWEPGELGQASPMRPMGEPGVAV